MKINLKSKKRIKFLSLIFSLLILFALRNNGYSQCVECGGTTTSGLYPSAIGRYTSATGNYSFAGGIYSVAEGQSSFAFGNRAKALGGSSIAFGEFINITASTAIGIGLGFDITNPLVNNIPRTLMIGIGSTKPTFFVGESIGVNSTGKIGIGNMTDPQAKLHILADADEDASLLLEPSNPKEYMANLQLLDANSGLSVGARSGLELFTNLKSMQFTAPVFNFTGNQVNMPALRINNAYSLPVTVGKPGEFLNSNGLWETPEGGGETYWLPSGTDIYFSNNVGIGTSDLHGYQLAVKGKIISEEVVIQFYNAWQWPDFVFDETYALMPLAELEQFIQINKHLPGIPDAQEVVEEGVSVGEMNALLLQKIEELTLYMLQQQKEIEVLKKQLGN